MNISCRIANADTQCGRITNPPERANRNIQQKQFNQLCRKYHLSQDQCQELHRIIHGEGLGYKELEEVIIN